MNEARLRLRSDIYTIDNSCLMRINRIAKSPFRWTFQATVVPRVYHLRVRAVCEKIKL